ncbi:MAG: FG-GAP-like repeat-containing protein [Planctomycetota bacterium]
MKRSCHSRFLTCGWLSGALIVSTLGCRNETPVPPNVTQTEAPMSEAPKELTLDSAREVIQLHNRGLAALENMDFAEADQSLNRLFELLPNHPAVARNVAVARVLSLIANNSPYSATKDASAQKKRLEEGYSAIATFRKLAGTDGERAIASLLEGKLAAYEDAPGHPRIQVALQHFQDAIRMSGDKPAMWYAYALAMEGNREYSESPELLRTLQKVSELAPENYAVIGKYVEKLALGINSKNPEVVALCGNLPETLERAQKLIAPLNAAIRTQQRIDLVDMIQKGLDAAKPKDGSQQADLKKLFGPAMMSTRLLLPELVSQIDRRRIDLNLLEYVVVDLASSLKIPPDTRAVLLPEAEPTVLKALTAGSGLQEIASATSVQFCDMNLDGAEDMVVVAEGRVRVYSRGLDPKAAWTLMMESSADAGSFKNCLLIDFDRDFDRALADIKAPMVLRDRDGDRRIVTDQTGRNRWYDTDSDVIAWSSAGVVVFRNDVSAEGVRSLTALPQPATVSGINDLVAADLEADGDLDLIFAEANGITLWKNIDGKTFERITEGVAGPATAVQSLAIGDWNRDMAMDIVGVTAAGKAGWLQNMLHTRFRWLDDIPCPNGAMDVLIDELNGDGRWDLMIAGPAGVTSVLPTSNETPADSTSHLLGSAEATHILKADLDNDSRTDIISCGPGGVDIIRGTGNGMGTSLKSLIADNSPAIMASAFDLDDDGDLDLVVLNADGTLRSLINEGGSENQWIEIVPRAVADDPQFPSNRVNMQGIGSTIELRSGLQYQAHIVDAAKLHFGLGQSKVLDSIRTIWTDGIPQHVARTDLLRSRLGILAPQILTGSCPYIYTWNGERFEFFSDCLWAAPIGLVQATGDLAPTREWEYLLIPGEKLKPKNDRYVLQLTEELWEAAYFDEVKLVAVDHPADVSIFTNEKVGSPQMAAHRIHTVKNARQFKSITDSRGHDLLPGLRAQDQDYVQAFEGRILQGLVDEWTMEFDPGALSENGEVPKDIRLFLIGWVFPTNTSLNHAIVQNPSLDPPAPPSLEVQGVDGQWKVASPFIGFPSGKTKAMVVDLSGLLPTPTSKFRIRSSMELYWDAAFLTVNEGDAPTQSLDCPVVNADLHYRGFSRRIYADNALFRNGRAPEGYDYDSVTTEPRWSEMLGRFTRYGNTTTLLMSQDDRMVVMGPGDELTVEFSVPGDVPPNGWKRDFVLYNVGWDKDADLNTVYGQSSEPYPFRAMTRYPIAPEESEPASPEYLQYLREYQTREYVRFQFRDTLRHEVQN